jgi:hypothetical protein
VSVALDPLPGRPDLYPLDVAVEIDGAPAGTLRVEAVGTATGRFPVPRRADPEEPLEVKLIAPRWVVESLLWRATVAAFLPVRIACEDG